MDNQYVSSEDNKIIKHINSLKLRKHRKMQNQFIIEGLRMIAECKDLNPDLIDFVVFSSNALESLDGKRLFKQIHNIFKVYEVSDKLFKKISDTENPQGILAVVKMPQYNILELLNKENAIYVILDRIQDPGNMGTIIRTAVSVNAKAVILTKGSVDPYNSKTVRSTMGAILNIPIVEMENNAEWITGFREKNIRLIGSSLESEKSYVDADYSGNIGIIIGNEAKGMDRDLLGIVDENVYIPILGKIDSLNAAVAAGILLYKAIEGKL